MAQQNSAPKMEVGSYYSIVDYYFHTEGLLPEANYFEAGIIEEVIDAIPDRHWVLLEMLRDVLRRDGVC